MAEIFFYIFKEIVPIAVADPIFVWRAVHNAVCHGHDLHHGGIFHYLFLSSPIRIFYPCCFLVEKAMLIVHQYLNSIEGSRSLFGHVRQVDRSTIRCFAAHKWRSKVTASSSRLSCRSRQCAVDRGNTDPH